MQDKIPYKITSALESIDGIVPAEPRPYLLTRINAALSTGGQQGLWSRVAAFIQKPAVATCSIGLLLLLNIAVLNKTFSPDKKSFAGRSIQATDEFAVNVSGIYDLETQEP